MWVVAPLMAMVVSASHLKKHSLSICATFLGILVLVIPQPENTPSPISCISASGSNVTFCSFLQPINALAAMLVTDLRDVEFAKFGKPDESILSIDCNSLPLKLNAFSFICSEYHHLYDVA